MNWVVCDKDVTKISAPLAQRPEDKNVEISIVRGACDVVSFIINNNNNNNKLYI